MVGIPFLPNVYTPLPTFFLYNYVDIDRKPISLKTFSPCDVILTFHNDLKQLQTTKIQYRGVSPRRQLRLHFHINEQNSIKYRTYVVWFLQCVQCCMVFTACNFTARCLIKASRYCYVFYKIIVVNLNPPKKGLLSYLRT